jgi:hypothetical protein
MTSGQASQANDGAGLADLQQRYGYETWRDTRPPGEHLHVWNFFLGEAILRGWRAQRIQTIDAQPPWPRSVQSVWAPERGDGVLANILIFECPERTAARDVLMRALGQFEALLERRDEPGEVAFGPKEETVLLFAVANIVAVVRNAGPEVVSMSDVADLLDRRISERPEAGGPVVPEIQIFAGAEPKPGAKAVPLAVETVDPLGGPLWFKLFSPTGEVVEEDGRLVYRPEASPPHEITLYVINEHGGTASRTLMLGGG